MMESLQVRRIPVIAGEGVLVGIISLGDIATKEPENAADALERISQPSKPDR